MSFEEVPHTADVKIRIHARTLEELFSDACEALMTVMYGSLRKGIMKRKVKVTSSDIDSLLLDFLSEILFISEVEGIVFSKAVVHIEGQTLSAELEGETFSKKMHAKGTEVKGISYSGLMIRHDANGYMVDIVFDV